MSSSFNPFVYTQVDPRHKQSSNRYWREHKKQWWTIEYNSTPVQSNNVKLVKRTVPRTTKKYSIDGTC